MVQRLGPIIDFTGPLETLSNYWQGWHFHRTASGFVLLTVASTGADSSLVARLFTASAAGPVLAQTWTALELPGVAPDSIYFDGSSTMPGTDDVVIWWWVWPSAFNIVTLTPGVTKTGPDYQFNDIGASPYAARVGYSSATFVHTENNYSYGGASTSRGFFLGHVHGSSVFVEIADWVPNWHTYQDPATGNTYGPYPYNSPQVKSVVGHNDNASVWVVAEFGYHDDPTHVGEFLQRISLTGQILEEHSLTSLHAMFNPAGGVWPGSSIGPLRETTSGPMIWELGGAYAWYEHRLVDLVTMTEPPGLGAYRREVDPYRPGQTLVSYPNFPMNPSGKVIHHTLTQYPFQIDATSYGEGGRAAMTSPLKCAFYTRTNGIWEPLDVFGGWPALVDDYVWTGDGRPTLDPSHPETKYRSGYMTGWDVLGVAMLNNTDAFVCLRRSYFVFETQQWQAQHIALVVRATPPSPPPALIVPSSGPSRYFSVEAHYDSDQWSGGGQPSFVMAPINAQDAADFVPYASSQVLVHPSYLNALQPTNLGIVFPGWNSQETPFSNNPAWGGLSRGWHVVMGGIPNYSRTYFSGYLLDFIYNSLDPYACLVSVGTSDDGHPQWTFRWDDFYNPYGGRPNFYNDQQNEQPGLFIGLIVRVTLRPTVVNVFKPDTPPPLRMRQRDDGLDSAPRMGVNNAGTSFQRSLRQYPTPNTYA